LCQQHIRLHDHGPKCKAGVLWAVLFYACARVGSLAAACATLRDAPGDSAAHDALLATLPEVAELQRRLNRALKGDLPRGLRRRRQPLACDLTLIPYHGQPLHDANEVYRSQAKIGTTHFHACATAYVVKRGQRYTVALLRVKKGQALKEALSTWLFVRTFCPAALYANPELIDELNGRYATSDKCIVAYYSYLIKPSEMRRLVLKGAYEQVPKHHRCWLLYTFPVTQLLSRTAGDVCPSPVGKQP
jgi:hypothetical protein